MRFNCRLWSRVLTQKCGAFLRWWLVGMDATQLFVAVAARTKVLFDTIIFICNTQMHTCMHSHTHRHTHMNAPIDTYTHTHTICHQAFYFGHWWSRLTEQRKKKSLSLSLCNYIVYPLVLVMYWVCATKVVRGPPILKHYLSFSIGNVLGTPLRRWRHPSNTLAILKHYLSFSIGNVLGTPLAADVSQSNTLAILKHYLSFSIGNVLGTPPRRWRHPI